LKINLGKQNAQS